MVNSYIDGVKHYVIPEISIQTQRSLGADLILAHDECSHHVTSRILPNR